MKKQKIVAVDMGRRYLGFAYGYMDMTVAFPDEVQEISHEDVPGTVALIERKLHQYNTMTVVIGTTLVRSDALFATFEKNVQNTLEEHGYQVILWDEQVSTLEAENRMADAGIDPRSVRKDAIAAQIILERYLEALRRTLDMGNITQ